MGQEGYICQARCIRWTRWTGCIIRARCGTGGIREASAQDRKLARNQGGITHEQRCGQDRSTVYLRVLTASAPCTVEVFTLRTSTNADKYREAAACRDAAFLYLSNNMCSEKNLLGASELPRESVKHTKPVMGFAEEVLAYNVGEHVIFGKWGTWFVCDENLRTREKS